MSYLGGLVVLLSPGVLAGVADVDSEALVYPTVSPGLKVASRWHFRTIHKFSPGANLST